jgi:GAF domain-containing protein
MDVADSAEIDLRRSLEGLSRLAMGEGQAGLECLLRQVADFAAGAIPGADGAGLTLLEKDRPSTVVASADFVMEVDALQYGIGEGPCISAARDGLTMRSASLSNDGQWPKFGPRAAQLGVRSALSLPLIVDGRIFGSMNIYARRSDAFTDRAVVLGETFAVPAAISVKNAQALSEAQRLAAQLQGALGSRAVIDQALGIVISRSGCGPEEAFDKLRTISQAENRKLALVAQQVVEEATRRARARNSRSGD